MINLTDIEIQIKNAVMSTTINHVDELRTIVDKFFPENEILSIVEFLKTLKPFNKMTHDKIETFTRSKIYDSLIQTAFETYNQKSNGFTMKEIEDELDNYYDDSEYDSEN